MSRRSLTSRDQALAVAGHGASPWAIGPRRRACSVEVVAHVLAGRVPDGEQHALTLVVARAVLVRLAEVAERDRPVDRRQDLGEADVVGGRAST